MSYAWLFSVLVDSCGDIWRVGACDGNCPDVDLVKRDEAVLVGGARVSHWSWFVMGHAGRAEMSIGSKPCYMPPDCLVSVDCIHLLVPSDVFGDLLTPRYLSSSAYLITWL